MDTTSSMQEIFPMALRDPPPVVGTLNLQVMRGGEWYTLATRKYTSYTDRKDDAMTIADAAIHLAEERGRWQRNVYHVHAGLTMRIIDLMDGRRFS